MGKRRGRPVQHTSCRHCGKAEHMALGLCQSCYKYQKRNDRLPDLDDCRSRSPISKQMALEMYDFYRSGACLHDVAERFGFGYSTVRAAFKRHGLKRSQRGGAVRRKLEPSQVLQIRKLVEEGVQIAQVAGMMGVTAPTILKIADGKTYKDVGGSVRKPDMAEKRPCTRCTILTTNRSGLCAYCEQGQ